MKPLPRTVTGRLAMIMELLDTNVYDDDGNVIGQREPVITREDALKLLNMAEEEDQEMKGINDDRT